MQKPYNIVLSILFLLVFSLQVSAQVSPETMPSASSHVGGACDGIEPKYMLTVSGSEFCGEKSSSCVIETCCGDGHVISVEDPNNPGEFLHIEECEDGNDVDGDGCSNCREEICGDGEDNNGDQEECDDGNTVGGDGCDSNCQTEFCGDGVDNNNDEEECDDGNTVDDDECSNECKVNECGNGRVDPGEDCDEGDQNGVEGSGCSLECESDCQLYRLHKAVSYRADEPGGDGVYRYVKGIDMNLDELSCLADIWGDLGNPRAYWHIAHWNADTPAALALIQIFKDLVSSLEEEIPDDATEEEALEIMKHNEQIKSEWRKIFVYYKRSAYEIPSNIYFDDNCNVSFRTDIDENMICGNFGIGHLVDRNRTPISLLLSNETGLASNWTANRFALNPHVDAEWVYWKASAQAPLLVYDPENSLTVKDGSQLFGNYTFGGKHQALNPVSMQSAETQAWKNGYEALGSLDLNADGKLSGEELKDLALWFDENQNAISEAGEVKTLAEVGIVSINTEYDYESHGDLYSTLGFERVVDGEIVTGQSVDWKTPAYSSHADLVAALKTMQAEPVVHADSKELPEAANSAQLGSVDFTGTYMWSYNEEVDGSRPSGLLMMVDQGEEVFGFSILEEFMEANDMNIRGRLVKFPLMGQKFMEDGQVKLKFEVLGTNADSPRTKSIAMMRDGKMVGESMEQIQSEGKAAEVKYTWVAIPKK